MTKKWDVSTGRVSAGEWWAMDSNGIQVGWILKKPEGWVVTNWDCELKAPPFRTLKEARQEAESLLQDECGHGNPGA